MIPLFYEFYAIFMNFMLIPGKARAFACFHEPARAMPIYSRFSEPIISLTRGKQQEAAAPGEKKGS